MRVIASLRSVVSALFHRSRMDKEMEEELRAHIQDRANDLERSGVPRAEAERRARLEFGGYQKYKEEIREAMGTHFLETLIQDLRYGLRMLRKSPGFTAVAVLTLALGIGANTAIFSVVDAVLLRPLPYKSPARIVSLFEEWPQHLGPGPASGPNFLDWSRESQSLTDMAAFTPTDATLTNAGPARVVHGLQVTPNIFSLLGVNASLGRTLLSGDERAGSGTIVVISYAIWRAAFGSNPAVIGRTLELDRKPYQIVGVMPAEFRFPQYWAVNTPPDYWLPLSTSDLDRNRGSRWLGVIARLTPAATLSQAQAELNTIANRLASQFPDNDSGFGITIKPIHQVVAAKLRRQLILLQFAGTFLFLIACANVAGLLLAVSAKRTKELAVRAAIGAHRARLVRQLLTETILLFSLGAGLGLAVALWTKDILLALAPTGYLPQTFTVRLDPTILTLALAVSLAAGLLFGLLPALRSSRTSLNEVLKEGYSRTSSSASRTRSVFVIAEVAISLLLLIGGGLMLRSLRALLSVDTGFNPDHLIIASLELPGEDQKPDRTLQFLQEVQRHVEDLPGVEEAGFTSKLPLRGGYNGYVIVQGQPVSANASNSPLVEFSVVTPGYFRAAGIPLVEGRLFSSADISSGYKAIIVNRAFVRAFFRDGNALGHNVGPSTNRPSWSVIIGVVGDVRQWSISTPTLPEVYSPSTKEVVAQGWLPSYLAVRTRTPPAVLSRAIRDQISKLNPQIAVSEFTGRQLIRDGEEADAGYRTKLLVSFALRALVLAGIGVYGVVSNLAAQRTHEIGVRIALGAQRRDVLRLVLGQGMRVALIGVAIGLGAAAALGPALKSLLFGVSAMDTFTYAAVTATITAVALAACWIPARRAMRIEPMEALRYE
ncbi:MAG: ABC transporter permease [Candidatus Acidiferrales bacterium]